MQEHGSEEKVTFFEAVKPEVTGKRNANSQVFEDIVFNQRVALAKKMYQ
ncbi:hypothetical protein SS50377_21770 [Spironucleus salmonicida]|uniref:Uncharacterized protein n=1 Tax=Spironucleus salmonicida TaxID=348837 RepID=A0A9P8LX50_9EUKA|nr:hypothetical protein SS50377_21770 [Spironucleus salmonicida]